MRLVDAMKHLEREVLPRLDTRDAAAMHCLLRFARRVQQAQEPIRRLADALAPRGGDHLNQEPLFGGDGDD
jgi:hypothetical protein